jgi:hypothetical protein
MTATSTEQSAMVTRVVGAGVSTLPTLPPLVGGASIHDDEIDGVLDDSFPASDPPSWWAGTDLRSYRAGCGVVRVGSSLPVRPEG